VAVVPQVSRVGRDLHPNKSREVMAIARRIAALLLLAPALDANCDTTALIG